MTDGFAEPARAGDDARPDARRRGRRRDRVHFRNGDTKLGQALTMHPHGVRYTPDYDGAYLGDYTRAGGFVAPGEEFTYTWECLPESVGAWPYHDHGPNHDDQHAPRPVRRDRHPREGRDAARRRDHALPSLAPAAGHRPAARTSCASTAASWPATRRRCARRSARTWRSTSSAATRYSTFHVHGHRWRRPAGPTWTTSCRPEDDRHRALREDNPGRWLYHCHVQPHMEGGMAGWYLVDP